MTPKTLNEQAVICEALDVLMKHMEPAKVARFIAACRIGRGDYLVTKDKLFGKMTVDELATEIKKFRAKKRKKNAA
ncbi:MAG TPA: hypothetical protein VGQ99_01415 [Tepidisphaeraceae bacterium]|jgi:hypothetical protein|nr:hypothetical protein [Tepidisphaeraceae bacterium]